MSDEFQLKNLQRELDLLRAELEYLKQDPRLNLRDTGLLWERTKTAETLAGDTVYPFLASKGSNFGFDNGQASKNVLIEGDNLHALQIMQYTHKEAVDVIYIDPPYNTGKDNEFRYNDKWVDATDGYKHSKWLEFMYNRLILAKNLLRDTGVIFISIDDNEQARLKLLCDDIFNSKNYIGTACVKNNPVGRNDSLGFAIAHEYILAYVKNIAAIKVKAKDYFSYKLNTNASATIQKVKMYTYNDHIGRYKLTDFEKMGKNCFASDRPSMAYSIYVKDDLSDSFAVDETYIENGVYKIKPHNQASIAQGYTRITPKQFKGKLKRWRWGIAHYNTNKLDLHLKNELNQKRIYVKDRLNSDGTIITKQKSIFDEPFFTTSTGKKDFEQFISFGYGVSNFEFSSPKPVKLIQRILQIVNNSNATILDFFAGSGTTGHAVMELNREDGGNRKYILVTNNENNICEEVCYERLKRANEKFGYQSNLEYLKVEFKNKS